MLNKIKKISLVLDYYLNNRIFDVSDNRINRDNCLYPFWLLKDDLGRVNIDISTFDILSPRRADLTLSFDLPVLNESVDYKSTYLFLFESEVIKPENWNLESHSSFKRIYTWHDDLVDNKKYFKINFSHKFPVNKIKYSESINSFHHKKLCTLIAGNKKVSHELELYSERVKTIRWFEKYAFDSFDLYGNGWNKFQSENRYIRFLVSKIPMLEKLISPKFPSYKGGLDSKFETLNKYKFAICYENAQLIPGYITEKIFDCFFAGCIPVYWGAPNITEHIPSDCFIDRREFNNHEELFEHLNNMKEKEYLSIQQNITDFLFSTKADPYRAETFANTIVRHILDDQ